MFETLMSFLSHCWCWGTSRGADAAGDGDGGGGGEDLLWVRDLGLCFGGEFSMAVVQANQIIEDQCQVESGPFGTFVGVYDGHGGVDAARYALDHLFDNFRDFSSGPQGVTPESILRAFSATEEGFITHVSRLWDIRSNIATTGTCCLVGAVSQRNIYVASLGDSRAVLGRKIASTSTIAAIQLSTEHNANVEAVRQELKAQHPNDPQIVVFKHGCWRIKGIIQVSRSIGDAYMKYPQYNREPIDAKFRIQDLTSMPFLTANPTILCHPIQPCDSFLIFASDGLWEHLSNDQAVEIVHNHPRKGSAKRLLKAALQEAAKKREMRYSDLKRIEKKVRRHFHDDITVIVLFFNHDLFGRQCPPLSARCPPNIS